MRSQAQADSVDWQITSKALLTTLDGEAEAKQAEHDDSCRKT